MIEPACPIIDSHAFISKHQFPGVQCALILLVLVCFADGDTVNLPCLFYAGIVLDIDGTLIDSRNVYDTGDAFTALEPTYIHEEPVGISCWQN